MKVKYLTLAIAAMAAGVANAAYVDTATNLYLTGASAIRNNVMAAVKAQCTTDGGTMTVFKNGSSTSSLANQMAYVCSVPLAGTPITTVLQTSTGGSLNSILGMSNASAKQQQPISFADNTVVGWDNLPATPGNDPNGCTPAVAGSGALAGYSVRPNCGLDAKAASDGGFSDVEYAPVIEQVESLTVGTDGFDLTLVTQGATGVSQAFGIAVSDSLYKALQTAQGLAACGAGLGDPTPACQPSVSRADIVALVNSVEFTPQKNGVAPLGLADGSSIEYARRVSTSGTQSSAQIYFLGKGCLNGPNFGAFDIVGGNTEVVGTFPLTGNYSYSVNSGTGNVITRLVGATPTVPASVEAIPYRFGVVSAENPGTGTVTVAGWRFVKVNGAYIGDGGLNKANAIAGNYDFTFEPVTYKGPVAKTDANEAALIDALAAKMSLTVADGGAATVGIYITPENGSGYSYVTDSTEVSKYQRGGSTPNSCQPLASPL